MSSAAAVKTYKKGAHIQITRCFNQREFDCKGSKSTSRCCCSETKLSVRLVRKLQIIRKKCGGAVYVNSAYRCPVHNSYVGGASSSYHMKGMAADIRVNGMTPAQVAKLAQELGFTGIGMYNGSSGRFTHVDIRPTPYFWNNTPGNSVTVKGHGGSHIRCPYELPLLTVRRGDKGEGVKAVQWILNSCGYGCSVDGVFGANTEQRVREFQSDMLLAADGIVGSMTREALADAEA